jgi:hypothetical protein
MAKYAYVVFSEPTPGQEAEYNRWYNEQHLGDVLKIDGFVAAQRFKLAPKPGEAPGATPKYLAIYEIDSQDVGATLAQVRARANTPDMPMSDTITNMQTYLVQPIGERKLA